jgi:metal transporter CNNM
MHSNPYGGPRRILLAFATLLWLILAQIPSVVAAPIGYFSPATTAEHPKPPDDPSLWLYLSVAAALVLSGGAFAGLTIALMGQVSNIPYHPPFSSFRKHKLTSNSFLFTFRMKCISK